MARSHADPQGLAISPDLAGPQEDFVDHVHPILRHVEVGRGVIIRNHFRHVAGDQRPGSSRVGHKKRCIFGRPARVSRQASSVPSRTWLVPIGPVTFRMHACRATLLDCPAIRTPGTVPGAA